MILSRVFTVAFIAFLLASLLAYFFMDFRSLREQAMDALDSGKYFRILSIYHKEKGLEEEDYALLSLAVSGIEKQINLSQSESQKTKLLNRLNDYHEVSHAETKRDGTICTHLDDPFFSRLKKHAYWYQKALLEKVHASIFCNTPQKNSEYLNRILVEDPRNFMADTSTAIKELFRTEMDPIGEIELGFLRETIHFLSTQENSGFYQSIFRVTGDRVNFRPGPGTEYPAFIQLDRGAELFCFDKEAQEEIIGGKSGHWMHCFQPDRFRAGWIFSAQTERKEPDPELVAGCKERFSTLEYFTQVDFDTWREENIPLYFYGVYIPTKRKVKHGEIGFGVFRPENGKLEFICRKFSGKKNFVEFYYEVETSEEPIPLLELHLTNAGVSYPVYKISVTEDSLVVNGRNFVLDTEGGRETLSIKITSGQGDNLRGNLIHKNLGVIKDVPALPLPGKFLEKGNYSWEVCIPQAVKKSGDIAYLYGFRIGKD